MEKSYLPVVSELPTLQERMAVKFVEEMCAPTYQVIGREVPGGTPLYVVKATAGTFSSIGKGPNKKKAKCNAAASIISQMTCVKRTEDATTQTKCEDMIEVDNPVSELMSFSQKNFVTQPMFNFSLDQRLPYQRQHTCHVSINLTQKGVGHKKQEAKNSAAMAMLQFLKSTVPKVSAEHQVKLQKEKENFIPVVSDKVSDTQSTVTIKREVKDIPT